MTEISLTLKNKVSTWDISLNIIHLFLLPGSHKEKVLRFDLEPLLQGQMRIAKVKSPYNSLVIDPRGLQCETNL